MGENVEQLQEFERAQLLSRGYSLDTPMGSDPDHGSLVDLLEDDRTSPMEQLSKPAANSWQDCSAALA